MALAIQLELFEDNDELSLMKKEVALLRSQQDNLRRGLFARHGDLMKMYLKQQEELDEIKRKLSTKPEILKLEVSDGRRKRAYTRDSLRQEASI